jgi:hypothetical protein
MSTVRLWVLAAAAFAAGAAVGVAVVLFVREREPAADVPRRLEATVYLPRHDNSGRLFEDKFDQAVNLFVANFGGATLTDYAEGRSLHDKEVRVESIRFLVVSFEPGRLARFREVLNAAGQLLGQKEMYVRFDEPRVLLMPVEPKDK